MPAAALQTITAIEEVRCAPECSILAAEATIAAAIELHLQSLGSEQSVQKGKAALGTVGVK